MAGRTNIERRVSDTILERPITIKVGSTTYEVAHPTMATLILVSEAVSRLPETINNLDQERVGQEVLHVARDCRGIGEVLAIFIHGAKRFKRRPRRLAFLHLGKDPLRTLTDEILDNMSPTEIYQALATILKTFRLGDFFALTTFLSEINLLKPTKVVETETGTGTETTASGQ